MAYLNEGVKGRENVYKSLLKKGGAIFILQPSPQKNYRCTLKVKTTFIVYNADIFPFKFTL